MISRNLNMWLKCFVSFFLPHPPSEPPIGGRTRAAPARCAVERGELDSCEGEGVAAAAAAAASSLRPPLASLLTSSSGSSLPLPPAAPPPVFFFIWACDTWGKHILADSKVCSLHMNVNRGTGNLNTNN